MRHESPWAQLFLPPTGVFLSLLLLPVFLYGTDSLELRNPPLITSVNSFSPDEGLPTACLGKIVMDRKGRLWVNPCENISRDFGLHFFQYDGTQSIFYDLEPEGHSIPSPFLPLWVKGETTHGFLFGMNNRLNLLFSWHPDTGEKYFFPLDAGEILLNMLPDDQEGIILLIREEPFYKVYRIQGGEKELIEEIQLDLQGDTNFRFPYPFEVKGQHAWFLNQRNGLVRVDLSAKEVVYHQWKVLEGQLDIQKEKGDYVVDWFHWDLFALAEDKLVFFLGHQNGFWKLDLASNNLYPEPVINQFVSSRGTNPSYSFFSKDRSGNLLIQTSYDGEVGIESDPDYAALLLSKEGAYYDYTPIFEVFFDNEQLDFDKRFFGQDFQKELGWAMDANLLQLDLQANLNITAFATDRGMRSIINLDERNLLINSDLYLYKLDLEKGDFSLSIDSELPVNGLSPFIRAEDGKIWMANWEGGFSYYDSTRKKFKRILSELRLDKFIFINEHEIALFSIKGELFLYDTRSNSYSPFLYNGTSFKIDGKVNELLLDPDGKLWIATQIGLYKIDFTEDKVWPIDQPERLENENILCLHQGEAGTLWLGTSMSGVLIYDPSANTIKQIADIHGLANNAVPGILKDDHGNRWVSTFNGISVLSSEGEVLFELSQADGLADYEFNRTSYARLMDGRMAFGGIDGLSILDPNHILTILTQEPKPYIFLTHTEYFDARKEENSIRLGSFYSSNPIRIPAYSRYIKLDFALSEYNDLAQHNFIYRLLPSHFSQEKVSDIPWIDLGSKSSLTINNLPVGDYIIQIQGIDQKGNRAVAPLEVAIHVEQYFYRTWWFFLLCTLPFILGGWIWVRRVATEKSRLKLEVDRRTAQIQKDKSTIEQQALQLQELDRAKTRFFTNISHEFRTPLTVIMGMSEQIESPDRAKHLIYRNAQNLLALVNQILDLRKLESGTLSTDFIQGDVLVYLQYLIESFHSLAEGKEIELTFESTLDTLVLDYEPEKILYIVSNLLTNAIKFTPEGGEISVSLEADPAGSKPYYRFRVSDNGVGIPEDEVPHIFNRFYQVDDEQSRSGAGTGVGLTLVKELVHLLGGIVQVESQMGKGTTFTVQLPYTNQARLEEKSVPVVVQSTTTNTSFLSGVAASSLPTEKEAPRLLIVEDNADVMEYLTLSLQGNYQLQYARDGEEGIEKALEEVPDLIVSDVMMPKVDGFELCQALKTDERTSHIPIVLLTAKADVESRITGLERGADVYLAKPFEQRELEVQLNNLLAIREKWRKRYANAQAPEPSTDTVLQREDAFIHRIQQMILDNMAEEGFGVSVLCKKAGMSRTQLHNKIKSLTNRSTSHFIRKIRIEKAIALMKNSSMNISQVAIEVGVESLPYFSKIFSEETGLSPNKYREKHLQEH